MKLHYEVADGEFLHAGQASGDLKNVLKQLGVPSAIIRKVAIAMYEAEINMVIHANGGEIDVEITEDGVYIALRDVGPGIPDIEQAMTPGFSTATDEVRDMGFGAGMGLPNMKKNSDFLKVSSIVGQGTTVEIRFNLTD